jgi:hypothetical protein
MIMDANLIRRKNFNGTQNTNNAYAFGKTCFFQEELFEAGTHITSLLHV